jgi:hypothetical protein
MEPSTNLYAERPYFVGNGTGAANAACWTVKGGEKAVSSCFYFMAAKAPEIAPDRGVMIVKKIAPALIAE